MEVFGVWKDLGLCDQELKPVLGAACAGAAGVGIRRKNGGSKRSDDRRSGAVRLRKDAQVEQRQRGADGNGRAELR